jgi:peptidyl-prolyl cis-trans isomerase C
MFEKLKKLAREPLVHFLLIGAGIYGLYGIYAGGEVDDNERTVTVSAGDIQAMANQWTRMWSRPPTEEELGGIVRDHVRTQILFREALAMGLDVGDVVIERRLAQKVELLAQGLITPAEPTDEVLQTWHTDNPSQFKQPDLYTITHIFFDPDKREDATLADAEAARDKLNALDELPANYDEYGDRFMLQNYYSMRSELELRKMFGTGFVEQITGLEPGRWHGPVLSGYGPHLVMINSVLLTPQPAYIDIKKRLTEEWMAGQIDEMSERFVDELISRYEILVEETEVPVTVRGAGAAQ